MMTHRMTLIGASGNVLASAQVADEGAHFGGTIDLGSTPPALRALFDEFEEAVNDQMFACADEIQVKIGFYGIRARFDDGLEAEVKDLQVFPSTGDVSFKLVGSLAHAVKSA
jgi:hypothetical protein